MTLSTGQIIHNRYRIARLLGQGGMGAVYRAWDLNLNIPIALKEMTPQPGIDPRALAQLRQQFQREAQVLASIVHPSLPRVTDFFDWNGNAYLVMEFVEGESLDRIIARQGALPEAQVAQWAAQLLSALATCHDHYVLHRDIKPQNIIIRPDGRAVLVDFGLVKLWDPNHPQTQKIVRGMGTLEYASPEHLGMNRRHTEPRSDLYSLGATLYHALTGREPPSVPDRWANAGLLELSADSHVRAAVVRAMALSPDERFSNAMEMQAALRVVPGGGSTQWDRMNQEPVITRYIGVVPPGPDTISAPRDRWALEATISAVMALIGVGAIQIGLYGIQGLHLGLSIWAGILGGLGWFLGDLVFQALAKTEPVATTSGRGRPTQRLVVFTRRMTRRMTTAQQVALLVALLVGVVVSVALFSPLVARIPYVSEYAARLYALIGPLAYAATGRRRWRALIAHVVITPIAYAVLGAVIGMPADVSGLFLAAIAGGVLMEGAALLAERTLLRSKP